MNLFDWFLVAILAYSTIRAFLRGIFRELFSIAGLILGIILASWNYSQVATYLAQLAAAPKISPATAQIISFFLILFGVMLACSLIGLLLNRTAKAVGLGLVDRLLGAVFGLARGCLFAVAIMVAAAAFFPQTAWIENSSLSPYFLDGAHAVSFVVPHDLQQQILKGAQQLKHTAPDWIKPHQ